MLFLLNRLSFFDISQNFVSSSRRQNEEDVKVTNISPLHLKFLNFPCRKKGFVIDKITEDSFYENLLLGLTAVLKSCPFVSQTKLERYPPATLEEVCFWEKTNSLLLPEDLRNFYLSSNGFSFTYRFVYDKAESEEPSQVKAGIEVNPLSKLEKVVTTDTMYLTKGGIKISAVFSKIHLLTKLDENNCVVLAQFNPAATPNIWLYYKMKIFYFLCEDFVTYVRMGLAYVGAPGWQMAVLNASLPEWSSEMIQIIAPGIFENRQIENKGELNVLDCSIFDEDVVELALESSLEAKVSCVGSVCGKKKTPRNKPKK